MATAAVRVARAIGTQEDVQRHREHCAVTAVLLASVGGVLGRQVRIRRGDELALYTVSELLHETADPVVRMGLTGRMRLGTGDEFDAVLDTQVVDAGLSEAAAMPAGELVERLTDDGSQTRLVVVAPHGGAIEEHTDEQAERVAERLGPALASAWRCRGWKPDGGAFVRWHITSADLATASFPLLDSIASRRFRRAVAFHGFNDEPGVLVGGSAPGKVKRRVARAVRSALPEGLDVRIAEPDERFVGDDPRNLLNRLSPCGGVQLEQGWEARDGHALAIADAVADCFRPPTTPTLPLE